MNRHPLKPFRPYPRLWEALGADADKLLAGMSFDRLTDLSRTLATIGEAEMRKSLREGAPVVKSKGPHVFTHEELAASRNRIAARTQKTEEQTA